MYIMKKISKQKGSIGIIILLIILLVIAVGVFVFNKPKTENPPEVITQNEILGNKEDLVSSSISAGDTIGGFVNLSATVKNGYFFEGNILINLLDSKGDILKQGHGNATSDWMTSEPVSFEALIDATGLSGDGYIEIKQDDPSDGEGGPAKKILIPVTFEEQEQKTMSVKLYFPNTKYNPDMLDCSLVYPVTRTIPYTLSVAQATTLELLKGPTTAELNAGYISAIPEGVELNSIKIEDGTLFVDFNQEVQSGGGSCAFASRLGSLNQTLKQFSTVKNVVISVEGNDNQSEIFQP
jgi:hypothetical protein